MFDTSSLRGRLKVAAAALTAGLALQAAATPPTEAGTAEVRARLAVGVASVQPGQPLQVGLQQRIAEHWHTYWLNPGDSGLPTTIAWALPAGATASAIEWPTPSRFLVGPIANYGYADEVTLLSRLQVPASLKAGDTFAVEAKVDWLVCKDVCIPQTVQLGLSLPVKAEAPAPSADAGLLQQAATRIAAVSPWPLQWRTEGRSLQLQFSQSPTLPDHDGAYFYAARWGQVAHAENQTLQRNGPQGWQLTLPVGEAPPAAGDAPSGLLVLLRGGTPVQAYAVGQVTAAAPGAAATSLTHPASPANTSAAAAATLPATTPAPTDLSLGLALLLALLGGIVLNLMPCVFPVLTIKALSLLQTAQGSRRVVRLHGLAYAGGVLLSFVALASVLIALKAGGDQVGWGFQFQSPEFVLVLALLMFGVGLSLSGVVTLGGSVAGLGSGLAAQAGYRGSFFTGVLATVVATPCTAPFMGAAIGYALTQPAGVTLAIFLSLGLGLALPYLLLCEWPALQRRLPRPGAWMDRLKQAMAFPMYASAAWLAWVLTQQAGAAALAVALGSALLLAFAAWLYGSTRTASPRWQRGSGVAAGALAVAALATGTLAVPGADAVAPSGQPGSATASAKAERGWEPYSPERLSALRAEGKPVFVNLTADWCLTCLVNERVALHTDRVEAAFQQAGVTRLKGDWTRQDERITRLLAEHGRSGVPLYLFYPAGANSAATLLPQLLTPDLVLAALNPPAP